MDQTSDRDREERIRDRAYRLWQDEGQPAGRADVHWDQATELVAIEENYKLTTEPVPSPDDLGPSGEPIEPIEAVANLGEFPTMTDQGEEQPYPMRRSHNDDAAQSLDASTSGEPAMQELAPAPLSTEPASTATKKASSGRDKASSTGAKSGATKSGGPKKLGGTRPSR